MKTPKGFGKTYFTFASILAYSVQNKLQAQVSSIHSLFKTITQKESQEEEESPPDELLTFLYPTLQSIKPCHCDCFFRRKTQLAMHLFHYIPRCPYYTTYFAFRRTGVHPPYLSF